MPVRGLFAFTELVPKEVLPPAAFLPPGRKATAGRAQTAFVECEPRQPLPPWQQPTRLDNRARRQRRATISRKEQAFIDRVRHARLDSFGGAPAIESLKAESLICPEEQAFIGHQ